MNVKGKACRNCRKVIEDGSANCSSCGSNAFTTFWKGYVVIIKPDQSQIAQKMGIQTGGMHALRLSR